MKNCVRLFVVALLLVFSVKAADDVVTAVHGTITKLDAGSRTMTVKVGRTASISALMCCATI